MSFMGTLPNLDTMPPELLKIIIWNTNQQEGRIFHLPKIEELRSRVHLYPRFETALFTVSRRLSEASLHNFYGSQMFISITSNLCCFNSENNNVVGLVVPVTIIPEGIQSIEGTAKSPFSLTIIRTPPSGISRHQTTKYVVAARYLPTIIRLINAELALAANLKGVTTIRAIFHVDKYCEVWGKNPHIIQQDLVNQIQKLRQPKIGGVPFSLEVVGLPTQLAKEVTLAASRTGVPLESVIEEARLSYDKMSKWSHEGDHSATRAEWIITSCMVRALFGFNTPEGLPLLKNLHRDVSRMLLSFDASEDISRIKPFIQFSFLT